MCVHACTRYVYIYVCICVLILNITVTEMAIVAINDP